MNEWRVFWHPGSTRFDVARGTMVALEHRDVPSETEARALVRQLQNEGRSGVSISPPDNAKALKGAGLRDWMKQ